MLLHQYTLSSSSLHAVAWRPPTPAALSNTRPASLPQALPFLGPLLDDATARGVAEGTLDPSTLEPFDIAAMYSGCTHAPPLVAALLGFSSQSMSHGRCYSQHTGGSVSGFQRHSGHSGRQSGGGGNGAGLHRHSGGPSTAAAGGGRAPSQYHSGTSGTHPAVVTWGAGKPPAYGSGEGPASVQPSLGLDSSFSFTLLCCYSSHSAYLVPYLAAVILPAVHTSYDCLSNSCSQTAPRMLKLHSLPSRTPLSPHSSLPISFAVQASP